MGDPLELFDRLFRHYDAKGCGDVLVRAQSMRPTVHMTCPTHYSDWDHEDHPKTILLVHPLNSSKTDCTLEKMLLESAAATRIVSLDCCSEWSAFYDNRAHVLTINVVWGARSMEDGAIAIDTDRRFSIPNRLRYGDSDSWILKGVICRFGGTAESGHYTAIVLHNGQYWKIDDNRVSNVGNVTQEAFKNAGYPVMIVYEKEGAGYFEVSIPQGPPSPLELTIAAAASSV